MAAAVSPHVTPSAPADLAALLAAALAGLGPFEDQPRLAVAVSGGADSMALALLAQDWVTARGGSMHALVVDHGLRAESAAEARLALNRMAVAGIPGTLLTLTGLRRGSALAERARIARYDALTAACRSLGVLHLLLGHHALDQAETLAMRVLRQSGRLGLAGMPALTETGRVRLLRPLLTVPPGPLRDFLRTRGIDWIEDPSNEDQTALRPRLRRRLRDVEPAPLIEAARNAGLRRAREEAALAEELAAVASIRPEGFATVTAPRVSPGALATLLRTVAGSAYAPSVAQVTSLAASLRPATLAGVRLVAWRDAWLLAREEAAMARPVEARPGARWDNRMRFVGGDAVPPGATIGALGDDAAVFRRQTRLPSVVLRTLPALRNGKVLLAVPHLGYVCGARPSDVAFLFDPPRPAAGALFQPI